MAANDAPEWVDDPTVPLTDDERQHYMEQIAEQAEAGNAMAVLATRAMRGMEAVQKLLVDYTVIVEEGAKIALDAMGAEGSVPADAGIVVEGDGGLGDEDRRKARALKALAAHARMTVALAVLVDRHSLRWDEAELVERALEVQPDADYEADVAAQAIGLFLEDLRRRGVEMTLGEFGAGDATIGLSRQAAVSEIVEGTEAFLRLGWERNVEELARRSVEAEEGVSGDLTFWDGEPCLARRVWVEVADDVTFHDYWAKPFVGERRRAVEVVHAGRTFYLDDDAYERPAEQIRRAEERGIELAARIEPGEGWRKVTEGRGSPTRSHRELEVKVGSVEPREEES